MDNYSGIKVLLIGTGAIGSFYGGKLSQAGATVSTVCRSDYNIVKDNGIRIKSVNGDFDFRPDSVFQKASEYNDIADFIIVATKVLPEIDVVSIIRDAVKPSTSIVLLQNGVNIEKEVADAFPENEIISALAFVCVSRIEYGLIDHQDYGRVVIGSYPSGISDKVKLLEKMFKASETTVKTVDDIIAVRWEKLLWNAPFNPVSVIGGGVNTKEMLAYPLTESFIENIMKEVYTLSVADGHPVDESLIKKNIEDTYRLVPYKTSMLLDFEAGRPMEVEAILGNAVRIADKYGVEVPYLKSIYALLDLINRKNISKNIK